MKITKRQLRQIIKEEKAKLQEQSGMSSSSREAIDSMKYNFEKAINSQLSLENRFWYKDPDTIQAVMEMLDALKAQMQEYSRM
tara:strand:- start:193 stop:441 length:249 start_codon:yes stop_codon:yes gene_type:complete